MGGATWSADAYRSASATYSTKTRSELFSKRKINEDFDPKNIIMRESRDSEQNPRSTPIIIGLDVTGSMGMIAENIAKEGLGRLVEGILDSKPVTDPHIMMMAIGDIVHDDAPLQVTQFEADIRIAEQLTSLWLESGGGGNSYESYDLPWLFASEKTEIDSFSKRGVKGYLFTMGDELPPQIGSRQKLNEKIGVSLQCDTSINETLASAQERYNVFHLIIEEGSFARRDKHRVYQEWKHVLGKRAIRVNNYHYIPEIIQSVLEVSEGHDPVDVVAQWQSSAIKESVQYALFGDAQQ